MSGERALPSFALGTAQWVAAARAREAGRPDRLFIDPWAEQLAGPAGAAALAASEAASGQENVYLPVRARFFDDVLLDGRWAIRVVLLGAGLDTRAQRLEWTPDTVVFEVDHPEVLDAKTHGAGRCPCPMPATRDRHGPVRRLVECARRGGSGLLEARHLGR